MNELIMIENVDMPPKTKEIHIRFNEGCFRARQPMFILNSDFENIQEFVSFQEITGHSELTPKVISLGCLLSYFVFLDFYF